MKKEQTSLLIKLARKLQEEETSKESVIQTLSSAGIVTKKGEMTKSFPNLKRVLAITDK